MQFFGLLSVVVTVAIIGWWFVYAVPAHAPERVIVEQQAEAANDAVLAQIAAKADVITVNSPAPSALVGSPIEISGKARGYWFFEASFPVVLVDWDGQVVAETYATASADWMTEDFVPYNLTLVFENPYHAGDPEFMRHGALILKKDNPSGLPENDDAIEIPVVFAAAPVSVNESAYGETINAAREAADLMSQ